MFTSISLLFWPNRALYPPALQYYGRAMEINSHIWTGRRSNPWVLDLLAVAPFAQRKGYGQRLVQWGLQRAREEKAPASVVSSYGSDGFYLKSGFETVAGNIGDGEENPLKGCKGGSVLFMDAPLEDEDEDEDEESV